jgi:response regulator NasT
LNELLDAFANLGDGFHITARLDRAIDLPAWVEELQPDAIIMDTDSPSRDTLEQIVVMSEKTPQIGRAHV